MNSRKLIAIAQSILKRAEESHKVSERISEQLFKKQKDASQITRKEKRRMRREEKKRLMVGKADNQVEIIIDKIEMMEEEETLVSCDVGSQDIGNFDSNAISQPVLSMNKEEFVSEDPSSSAKRIKVDRENHDEQNEELEEQIMNENILQAEINKIDFTGEDEDDSNGGLNPLDILKRADEIMSLTEKMLRDIDKKILADKKQPKKSEKNVQVRPNVFIAVPIKNPSILQEIDKLQKDAVGNEEVLLDCMEGIEKAHITLLVARIEKEDLPRAKMILSDIFKTKIRESFRGLEIGFNGVSQFGGGRVIWVKPVSGNLQLQEIESICRKSLSEAGLHVVPYTEKELTPHLTIFKHDYKKTGNRGLKVLKQSWQQLEKHGDRHFGVEQINALQFLSMEGPKDDDGYYNRLAEFSFCEKDDDVTVDESCTVEMSECGDKQPIHDVTEKISLEDDEMSNKADTDVLTNQKTDCIADLEK